MLVARFLVSQITVKLVFAVKLQIIEPVLNHIDYVHVLFNSFFVNDLIIGAKYNCKSRLAFDDFCPYLNIEQRRLRG